MPETPVPNILRCQECGTPVAEIRDGQVILKQRHHGVQHVTVLSLEVLIELLQQQRKRTHIAA